MTQTLTILIPGVPVPKGRPRARIVAAPGKRMFVSHYTPSDTVKYEERVAREARLCLQLALPLDQPIEVDMAIYVPIPESWSEKKKASARAGEIKPTGRNDIDNYAKAILDGMNGIAYRDDCLITDLSCGKRYSDNPRVVVCLTF